jgi:hypothetical protein
MAVVMRLFSPMCLVVHLEDTTFFFSVDAALYEIVDFLDVDVLPSDVLDVLAPSV